MQDRFCRQGTRSYFHTGQGVVLWHLRANVLGSNTKGDELIRARTKDHQPQPLLDHQLLDVRGGVHDVVHGVLHGDGACQHEYSRTKSYSQLHVDLPVHLSTDQVRTQTLQGRKTYIYGTFKASTLGCHAFRYLHAVVSWMLTGRGDNTGVLNLRDLYFLWSMVARGSIHIGHEQAC